MARKQKRRSRSKRAHGPAGANAPEGSQLSPRQRRNATALAVVVVLVVVAVVFAIVRGSRTTAPVVVSAQIPPALDSAWAPEVKAGALTFAANCQVCHGPHASGSKNGPPLVHRIYEPSHHADGAFWRAVRAGVSPHHWSFGPMPRVDLEDNEVRNLIVYVRTLQRSAGIY